MQQITLEELINYKILPFDVYADEDVLLFPAGEVLTPGKFLQLRHVSHIYKKDEIQTQQTQQVSQSDNMPQKPSHIEVQSLSPSSGLKVDGIDISDYQTTVNKKSVISCIDQHKIKKFYDTTLENFDAQNYRNAMGMLGDIKTKIIKDFVPPIETPLYSSQLRLMGDYKNCHTLNVATLSATLAQKINKTDEFINEVTVAALLHDIGKTLLPPELITKTNLTSEEQKLYETHTKLGYKIIKEELNLPEKIARVALEHHEKNDGTGYPFGNSGDFICLESQIVNVCNFYDNIAFNRTNYKISNSKEALKIMLEMGSKAFAVDLLYTFVFMFNYDDTLPYNEMLL